MMRKYFFLGLVLAFSSLSLKAQDTVSVYQRTLLGHKANVETFKISSDGRLLASGGWDNVTNLYSLDSVDYGKLLKTFTGHNGAISCVAFSADNSMIATGSKDFTLRIYDVKKGTMLFVGRDFKDAVSSISFDDSGKYIFAASNDGTIRWYNVRNFEDNRTERVIKYGGKINQIMFSPAKGTILVASGKNVIEQIGTNNKVSRTFNGHGAAINCLALTTNKRMMASGSDDKTIILWDMASGGIVRKLTGHGWKVTSLMFTMDGKYLVSTCNNGETKIWDVATGKCYSDLQAQGTNARHAEFLPNQKSVAVAYLQTYAPYGVHVFKTPALLWPVVKTQPVKTTPGKTTPAKSNVKKTK